MIFKIGLGSDVLLFFFCCFLHDFFRLEAVDLTSRSIFHAINTVTFQPPEEIMPVLWIVLEIIFCNSRGKAWARPESHD